jgi:Bacterial regulatory proteins, luxR family
VHVNKCIARSLGIAPETVKTHVKAIFGKLKARTRAQAVLAQRHRLALNPFKWQGDAILWPHAGTPPGRGIKNSGALMHDYLLRPTRSRWRSAATFVWNWGPA